MSELTGVIPITATPFDSDGRVDEASVVSLVEFEARCGVHGLNVQGIMGEFPKLTESERRRVAEIFIKSAGVGLALRKEVLRLRGAIRSSHVRPPGPTLDDVTRVELLTILERTRVLSP